MDKLLAVVGGIALIVFILIIGPWLFIWGVNTLIADAMIGAAAGTFVPQITFGFWTWLAAAILNGFAIGLFRKRS